MAQKCRIRVFCTIFAGFCFESVSFSFGTMLRSLRIAPVGICGLDGKSLSKFLWAPSFPIGETLFVCCSLVCVRTPDFLCSYRSLTFFPHSQPLPCSPPLIVFFWRVSRRRIYGSLCCFVSLPEICATSLSFPCRAPAQRKKQKIRSDYRD